MLKDCKDLVEWYNSNNNGDKENNGDTEADDQRLIYLRSIAQKIFYANNVYKIPPCKQ